MMQPWWCGGISLALVLAMSSAGYGQAKDKKKNKDAVPAATPDDYKQIQKAKEVEGKLVAADAGLGNLSIQLDFPHLEPNPNFKPGAAGNQQQHFYNLQVQIMKTTNPYLRQQRMANLVREMQNAQNKAAKGNSAANPYKVVHDFKEFDMTLADKIVVRKLNLGIEYDNEGNILQRTKEELAKLKGTDAKVPGYAAKIEDLQSGQTVHLYLNPGKAEKAAKTDTKAEGVGNGVRPVVRMIVILQEANKKGAPTKGTPKK